MEDNITKLKHLRQLALKSQKLSADVANAAAEALEEMDQAKANSSVIQAFSLKTSGWTADSSVAAYPYRYTLAVSGVTASTRADVVLDAASAMIAADSQMCPVTETTSGSVICRSVTVPSGTLSGQLYLTQQ